MMVYIPVWSNSAVTGADGLRASRVDWKRVWRILRNAALFVAAVSVTAFYFTGGGFLLGADGIVTRERVAIAVPFDARVTQVFVHPGDKVEVGQKIAVVESASLTRAFSELSVEMARISSRVAEIESRRTVVDSMIPFTEVTSRQAKLFLDALVKAGDKGSGAHNSIQEMTTTNLTAVDRQAKYFQEALVKAGENGLVNNKFIQEMTSTNLTATERAVSLKAEQDSLPLELKINLAALDAENIAYANLKKIYNDGVFTASVSGTVGNNVAVVGQVLAPEHSGLADIYIGKSFVLAFMPENYLFDIEEGQAVGIRAHNQTFMAHIEKVLPLTEALPLEFQNPNKVRDRGQMVRIAFNDANQIALNQKIRVTDCYTSQCVGFVQAIQKAGNFAAKAVKSGFIAVADTFLPANKTVSFNLSSARNAAEQGAVSSAPAD
jgi:multidrug resistance efflux pump